MAGKGCSLKHVQVILSSMPVGDASHVRECQLAEANVSPVFRIVPGLHGRHAIKNDQVSPLIAHDGYSCTSTNTTG